MVTSTPEQTAEPNPPVSETATGRRAPSRGWIAVLVVAALVLGMAIGAAMSSGSEGDAPLTVCDASAVADHTLPSVVTVLTTGPEGRGNGTGEIIKGQGYILTNDHVIAPAIGEGSIGVRYSDGSTVSATVVGRDPATDLAVLRADDEAAGWPVIQIGSSSDLRVGQPVVALGAPLGLYSTVTSGIVSALGRYVPLRGPEQTRHIVNALQTDAAINPGNSGGPVVDCNGAMIGVATAIATVPNAAGHGGGGSVGIGFAIPVDVAKPLADQLITHGRVQHPSLGFNAIPTSGTDDDGVKQVGLYVTAIQPGGPAETAGLQESDVVVAVNGQPARSADVLTLATLKGEAGDTVTLTYIRDGQTHTADVVLGAGG